MQDRLISSGFNPYAPNFGSLVNAGLGNGFNQLDVYTRNHLMNRR